MPSRIGTISKAFLTALVLVMVSASGQAIAKEKVGVAAAVMDRVTIGAPEGAQRRALDSGDPVFLNEEVRTDDSGSLQIILLDGSVLTMGPNSQLAVDQFAFRTDADASKAVINFLSGALRYVSGSIAKQDPENVSLATPMGLLGVRGTTLAANISGDTGTFLLIGPGQDHRSKNREGAFVFTDLNGDSAEVMRPNFAVTASVAGGVGEPFSVGSEDATSLVNAADGGRAAGGTLTASAYRAAYSTSGQGIDDAAAEAAVAAALSDGRNVPVINTQLATATDVDRSVFQVEDLPPFSDVTMQKTINPFTGASAAFGSNGSATFRFDIGATTNGLVFASFDPDVGSFFANGDITGSLAYQNGTTGPVAFVLNSPANNCTSGGCRAAVLYVREPGRPNNGIGRVFFKVVANGAFSGQFELNRSHIVP